MRVKSYCINLPPLAWKRPGVYGKIFYNQQQQERTMYGLYMEKQHGPEPMFEGPVHMDITFFMPIPRHKSKKPKTLVYCATTPDIDNLIKHILDTARGILIKDDRTVVSVNAKKVYDKNPRTSFTLSEIE